MINEQNDGNLIPMNDFYTNEPKSSIKLIKNSRGINWEIKIVVGEEELIDGIMAKAVSMHKKLLSELETDIHKNKKEENNYGK